MMVQPTISATPVLNDNKLPQTTSTAVKKQVRLPSMASVLKADPGMLQVWEATSDCPAMDSYQQEPINMQHVDWNRPDDSTMKNLTERVGWNLVIIDNNLSLMMKLIVLISIMNTSLCNLLR